MSNASELLKILSRLVFRVTSGRFIFTIVVALVYAFLAVNGMLTEDRINEITLVVLYAYFSKHREDDLNGHSNDNDGNNKETKT